MWYGYSMPKNGCDYWYDSQYKTFESMEPLLEMVSVPHSKWTIIGAETGHRKNKVAPERKWIEHQVGFRQLGEALLRSLMCFVFP